MIIKRVNHRLLHAFLFSVALCSIGIINQHQPVMAKSHTRIHKVIKHHKQIARSRKRHIHYRIRHKRIIHKINKKRSKYHVHKVHHHLREYPGDIRYNGHLFNKVHFYHVLHIQLLNDINKTRKEHNLPPLKNTKVAQKLANYRASKVGYAYNHYNDYRKHLSKTSNQSDGWVHGNYNHTSVLDYLRHNHLNYEWDGENAQAFGSYYNRYSDGSKFIKPNTNAKNIADDTNDNLMNHDMAQGNKNGHRINELNPYYKDVGIGVSYNRRTHIGGITEDFLS